MGNHYPFLHPSQWLWFLSIILFHTKNSYEKFCKVFQKKERNKELVYLNNCVETIIKNRDFVWDYLARVHNSQNLVNCCIPNISPNLCISISCKTQVPQKRFSDSSLSLYSKHITYWWKSKPYDKTSTSEKSPKIWLLLHSKDLSNKKKNISHDIARHCFIWNTLKNSYGKNKKASKSKTP